MNLNATIIFQMLVFFGLVHDEIRVASSTKAMDERRQKSPTAWPAADKGKADLAQAQARISLIEASAKSENHARIVEAEKQAASLIDQARREAESERARIVAQAAQDAAQEVQRARDSCATTSRRWLSRVLNRSSSARLTPAHAELLNQLRAQL